MPVKWALIFLFSLWWCLIRNYKKKKCICVRERVSESVWMYVVYKSIALFISLSLNAKRVNVKNSSGNMSHAPLPPSPSPYSCLFMRRISIPHLGGPHHQSCVTNRTVSSMLQGAVDASSCIGMIYLFKLILMSRVVA